MKNNARILSLLLTVAMVFGLMIVPAVADEAAKPVVTVTKSDLDQLIPSDYEGDDETPVIPEGALIYDVTITGNTGMAIFEWVVSVDNAKLVCITGYDYHEDDYLNSMNPEGNAESGIISGAANKAYKKDAIMFRIAIVLDEGVTEDAVSIDIGYGEKGFTSTYVDNVEVPVDVIFQGIEGTVTPEDPDQGGEGEEGGDDTTGGNTTGGNTTGGNTTGGNTTGGNTTGGNTTGGNTTGGNTTGGSTTGGSTTGGNTTGGNTTDDDTTDDDTTVVTPEVEPKEEAENEDLTTKVEDYENVSYIDIVLKDKDGNELTPEEAQEYLDNNDGSVTISIKLPKDVNAEDAANNKYEFKLVIMVNGVAQYLDGIYNEATGKVDFVIDNPAYFNNEAAFVCAEKAPAVEEPAKYDVMPRFFYIYVKTDDNAKFANNDRLMIAFGANRTLKFSAEEGYEIVDVLVNGKTAGAVDKLTIKGACRDYTVVVKTAKVAVEAPAETEAAAE